MKTSEKVSPIMTPSVRPKTKSRKRKRGQSLEAQLKEQAKRILETGMVEAMRVATLGLIAKKLDEIQILFRASGIDPNTVGRMVAAPAAYQVAGYPVAPQSPAPPVGPTCFQCGHPAIRKSAPNKFDPIGRWVCQTHLPLIAKDMRDDATDRSMNLNNGTIKDPRRVMPTPKMVINAPPTQGPNPPLEPEVMPVEEGQNDLESALAEALGES